MARKLVCYILMAIVVVSIVEFLNINVMQTGFKMKNVKGNEILLDKASESSPNFWSSGSTGKRFSGDKIRSYERSEIDPFPESASTMIFQAKDFRNDEYLNGSPSENCLQWAVVTTIFTPNESILRVSNLKWWCLVVVGDTISPDEDYKELVMKENVFYLTAEFQEKSSDYSRFVQMLPFKSFARKNVGYLFAIQFGAKVIYDFDDDNINTVLEDGKTIPPPFLYNEDVGFEKSVLLQYVEPSENVESLAFNPYNFMGPSHEASWPRGFPLDQLQENFKNRNANEVNFGDIKYSSIGVIQSLCNEDPDTDAVFRMTRPDSISFTFDRSKTSYPLLIPASAYTPYNAQATTHLYDAFWGLFLPITVAGRVTDIWRSYVTQRIMKDVGLHVLYTPPIVVHRRSAHDYQADFTAEADLYEKTSALLTFLDNWSSSADTLPERIFDLWIAMYEHDFIELYDVNAAKEWLAALLAIGYEFPSIPDVSSNKISPQKQPTIESQPFKSLPHFNYNEEGKKFYDTEEHSEEGLVTWYNTINWDERPKSAVIKIIMMTMDEWPLLKSWVLYHGYLLGFENLYIIDASTDPRCISFLRYSKDILGVNVIFSNANLNQLEGLITNIANSIGGSSDAILKMDTDEFLVINDEGESELTTNFEDYLSDFSDNQHHDLRMISNKYVSYLQSSQPTSQICAEDIYATPDRFPLQPFTLASKNFKSVYDSKKIFSHLANINLGGHNIDSNVPTKLSVVHFHGRCIEIEIENSRRVMERHNVINASMSDDQTLAILKDSLKCPKEDLCECESADVVGYNSFHKALFLMKFYTCPEKMKEQYYEGETSENNSKNPHVIEAMQKSIDMFDVNIKLD